MMFYKQYCVECGRTWYGFIVDWWCPECRKRLLKEKREVMEKKEEK